MPGVSSSTLAPVAGFSAAELSIEVGLPLGLPKDWILAVLCGSTVCTEACES